MEDIVKDIRDQLEDLYKTKCKSEQIMECQTKAFNICEGTGKRQCLDYFPQSSKCPKGVLPFYSTSSGVRLNNQIVSGKLSQTERQFICMTGQTYFQNLLFNYLQSSIDGYAWVYVGSRDGIIRITPGFKYVKQSELECRDYDPRLRSWYSQTAYSRKNIIYVVENGNGLKRGGPSKLITVKQALNASIITNDYQDFINIVTFSKNAKSVFAPPYDLNMVKLNESLSQRKLAFNKITELQATQDQQINYEAALLKVLEIYNATKFQSNNVTEKNNCNEWIIKFFSTSNPNAGETDAEQLVLTLNNKIKQIDPSLKLHFFGFKVTQEKIQNPVMQRLAKEYKGMYFQIPNTNSESSFLDKTKSYFDFLSHKNELVEPMWSKVYEDSFGLGMMSTVSVPAYFQAKDRKILIGVIGLDVLYSEFKKYISNQEQICRQLGREQLCFQSTETNQTILKQIQSQDLLKENYVCPQSLQFDKDISVFRQPIDTDQASCCIQEESSLGLIIGITAAVLFVILFIVVACVIRYFIKKKHPQKEISYKPFTEFDDFPQSRIRDKQDISPMSMER